MKKIYLILSIFIIFSCKSTPNKKPADDPGLSQLELTAEEDDTDGDAEFSDEMSADETPPDEMSVGESGSDENATSQDDTTDVPEIGENPETKTDDVKTEEKIEEKPLVAETVEEKKEAPKSEDKKPSVPAAPASAAIQPPPVAAKQETPPASAITPVQPPPAAAKEEKPAEEKQDAAQSESETPQTPLPRQPWIAPPPAVTAVKDDAPVPNEQVLVTPKEETVFSRTVRAMVGQFVEIPFRGNNWSYLEDIASRRGIVYDSRRNDSEGMIFTFRAEEAGTYILRFYRRDYIRDYILYDYVQVIVEESPNKGNAGLFSPPTERTKVTAEPRWPSALDEAAMLRGGTRPASEPPAASTSRETAPAQAKATPPSAASTSRETTPAQAQSTPPQTAPSGRDSHPAQQTVTAATQPQAAPQSTPQATAQPPASETQTAAIAPAAEKQEKLPPEELLKKAQDAFNGGKTAEAIALLDQYNEYYPGGNDELYWMYGQFYEANTASRNILLSLDYYRRLVNEYPQSRYYNDARRRISYLERFYINIQ